MNPEELFGRFSPMVYNLALRLSGNADDALAIARDAFLQAAKGSEKLPDGSGAGPWLYGITVQTWKDKVRSGKRRSVRNVLPPVWGGGADAPPGPRATFPETSPDAEPEKRNLEKAMAQLAPEDRAMLLLRDIDGRSYQEIAGITENHLGAVKSGISRARGDLRLKICAALKQA